MTRLVVALTLGLMLALAAAAGALAEQKDSSGVPLETYCNTAPDLGVRTKDSVDNWVAICTVWFQYQARCRDETAKEATKPKG